MHIEIFGPGCRNCVTVEKHARAAVAELGLDATVTKVTDYADIAARGVMATPGFAINGAVMSTGKVLRQQDIVALLREASTAENT